MQHSLVAIGEVMVELAPNEPGVSQHYQAGFAGDTFNTAVTLARLGVNTHYVTQLGDDSFSDQLIELMQHENVASDYIRRLPGRQPGLYLISNSACGERSFSYWRGESPARELWSGNTDWSVLEDKLMAVEWLYLSGITLSIMHSEARAKLCEFLGRYRNAGGLVAFDTNYRARLWPNSDIAKVAIADVLQLTDIALLTLEDEQALWGEVNPETLIEHHAERGVREIILKRGADAVMLYYEGEVRNIDVPRVDDVIDTTGAGDAFNAGYLAARLQSLAPEKAVQQGNHVAALTICHRGAIVDRCIFLSAFS